MCQWVVSVKAQEIELQTAMLGGLYTSNCIWVASTKRACRKQIQADIASAREALAKGSAVTDKMRKKLNLCQGVIHPVLTRGTKSFISSSSYKVHPAG